MMLALWTTLGTAKQDLKGVLSTFCSLACILGCCCLCSPSQTEYVRMQLTLFEIIRDDQICSTAVSALNPPKNFIMRVIYERR